MKQKLLFLGTSGDLLLTAKGQRKSGGIVLSSDDMLFFIDPGPGALQESASQNINHREITALLATHNHLAHSHDIAPLAIAATHAGLDPRSVLVGSSSVINSLPHPYKFYFEKLLEATPGKKFAIESIDIQPIATSHNDESAVGFKLYTPHSILGIPGDTKYSKDLAQQYSDVDVLILNTKHPREEKSATNLTVETSELFIEQAKPRLAILTHFGTKLHHLAPLYEARTIQQRTGIQTIAATDGLVLDPKSYSAKLKTRTLNLY